MSKLGDRSFDKRKSVQNITVGETKKSASDVHERYTSIPVMLIDTDCNLISDSNNTGSKSPAKDEGDFINMMSPLYKNKTRAFDSTRGRLWKVICKVDELKENLLSKFRSGQIRQSIPVKKSCVFNRQLE
jgi:hypothetical protein